jgi:hypothetical protein
MESMKIYSSNSNSLENTVGGYRFTMNLSLFSLLRKKYSFTNCEIADKLNVPSESSI